jgi:hypothetical protein
MDSEQEKALGAAEPEMREHYSFKGGQRGQYAHLFPKKPHVVLSPDVAAVFPDSDSVSEALRVLVKAAQASVPVPQEREAASVGTQKPHAIRRGVFCWVYRSACSIWGARKAWPAALGWTPPP